MSTQIVRSQGHSANIFVNYRREDSAGHAGRLFDALSDHFSGRLFMDVDTLEPGVDFVDAIEQAVGSCEVLIVIIGREWLTLKDAAGQRRLDDPADFVRLEVETALERKIRVIPVLVQDAPMPRPETLPPSLARLARRNAIELSDARWSYDVERLARTIQKLLEDKEDAALALAAAPERIAAPPTPVVPAVAEEAVAPPAPVVPAVAVKAAGSPVWRLSFAALVLVAAAVLASAFWMQRTPSENTTLASESEANGKVTGAISYQRTAGSIARPDSGNVAVSYRKPVPPQTNVSAQSPSPRQTMMLQPAAEPPSPRPTPPPPSTPAVHEQSAAPSPGRSFSSRQVAIPLQLPGEYREDREDRKKEEPMKKGDLIQDGPGVEVAQLSVMPPPSYPPSLVGSGRYAKVRLQVLVDENGAVAEVRIASASVDDGSADAEFREAALVAARQARFEPATRNGIAGKMWGELSYEFGTKK
ncbi:MAG TPA: TonB family protein [Thermoanaerobaculia bacterium]|nr:TonB family protein [Thermoanaerobaculia bacterium]